MAKIVEGLLSEHWPQMDNLLREHACELATHKHLMVLNPDKARYKNMEDAGMLLSLFAYEDEQLIGYSITFLSRNLHYSDLFYAHNDVLFVEKSRRNGKAGMQLISATVRAVKARGARLIV